VNLHTESNRAKELWYAFLRHRKLAIKSVIFFTSSVCASFIMLSVIYIHTI